MKERSKKYCKFDVCTYMPDFPDGCVLACPNRKTDDRKKELNDLCFRCETLFAQVVQGKMTANEYCEQKEKAIEDCLKTLDSGA